MASPDGPGLRRRDLLMAAWAAGLAWAVYTICGKGSVQPLVDTANNFIRCVPFTLLLLGLTVWQAQLSWSGIGLAIASGAVASGIGYAIWYSALKNLNITQAAISQLSVPIIAALGGVLLVSESLTTSLIIATVLILSGIAMVSLAKRKTSDY